MSLRDILFTPGITRPAVVLAALLCFAAVLLLGHGVRNAMARLAASRPAMPGLLAVPIRTTSRQR